MLNRIMYATVFVTDQDRALEFYTKGLGFEKRADFAGPEGRFLTVALQGKGTEVLLWPGSAGRGEPTRGAPAISVPGPLILQSDDLHGDFELMGSPHARFSKVSRCQRCSNRRAHGGVARSGRSRTSAAREARS
jgi:catechol 2,3-dioxygenase-like lactoylglutathione lyase family enzyme